MQSRSLSPNRVSTQSTQPSSANLRSRPFADGSNATCATLPSTNFNFSQVSVTSNQAPIQRQEDENKLRLDLLPPNLHVPLGGTNFDLSPGGLEFDRGPWHGSVGFGSPWSAELGYGAPLLPWTPDLTSDVYAGEAGMRGLLTNPLQNPLGNIGAIGTAAGTLSDVAGANSPYLWGVGLQGQYTSPEDWRVMAGLRLNF